MSRARELSRLGNTNVITADTSFNVGLGTEVPTNPATSANTQIVSAGIVSAYQLYGDGSALTGVAATDNINTNNIAISGIATVGTSITMRDGAINVTGVVTATSFDGDGSALTGLPAGLGTALATSGAGANIYYTNKVLSIESNLTTDIPSTSDLGYTQYQEIAVASGAELTVADGDQLVPDILGLTTSLGASSLTGGGGAVRADNFTNKTGGAPTFPDGINVTAGVGTFAGNVSIAGTLTYEDVTNVDSVGVVTARLGVIATAGRGVEITAGGLNVTAGIATFKNEVNADGGVDVAGGVKVGAALTVVGALDVDGVTTLDVLTAAEEVKVGSAVTIGTAGVSTFSNGVNLAPGTGLLREKVSSTTSAWSSSGDLNLDKGMVQYTSGNLGGTNNTLNITSSVGINTQMAVGEMIVVTGITSCSSSSAYVNALKIDHTTVQVAWVGGSAPSDGGGSGFDTYTFNIWKTASATYNVIGNQVKTS